MPFSGYDDLNPNFGTGLQAMIAAASQAGHQVGIGSGFRSVERQQQLWNAAIAKYGSEEAADDWVARPGKSNHNHGIAADLTFGSSAARDWVHANAARFGLHFPMSWEPWHIEPIGVEGRERGAYTTPPAGQVHPQDMVNDPYNIDTQFRNFMGSLTLGDMMGAEVMAKPTLPEPETLGSIGGPEDQAASVVEELA